MLFRALGLGIVLLASAPAAEAAWQSAAPAYPPPPVPRCDDVMAHHGARQVWVGHFSGKRYAGGNEGTAVFGRVGCFLSEEECRTWQNQNLSFAASATIMSCRPAGGRVR